MRRPHKVGLAISNLKSLGSQRSDQPWALLADAAHPPLDQLRAAVQRLEGASLGDLRDAKVWCELSKQCARAGCAQRVANAQASQAPCLGEATEHE